MILSFALQQRKYVNACNVPVIFYKIQPSSSETEIAIISAKPVVILSIKENILYCKRVLMNQLFIDIQASLV